MRGCAAALMLASAACLFAAEGPAPTFCVEWIEQTRQGFERLTLFADRSVVWKRDRGGAVDLKKQRLSESEAKFYCDYFRTDDIWSIPEDLRSGLSGDFLRQSVVTLTRPDGTRKEVRFDEFSAMTAEGAALRSSLEGLKGIFLAPLAPASRFTAESLPAGTILKRFDGALFRVKRVEPQKGVVELEAIGAPYSEFRKIEDLRFLFSPPERR